MTPGRHTHARDLLDSALALEPERRPAFLKSACGEDEALFAEVWAMLACSDNATEVMQESAIRAAAADRLEGRCIGSYRLLHCLGSGGMGSVYAASRMDGQFHQLVAVKLVKPGMDSEEILRRFLTERQVLASLDHPNIARLLDGGTTEEGLPYLVMEYVEGTAIDRYCDSHRLTITERLNLFRSVCSAVHYAHQNLVVHRDLKPGNILVTPKGVPKLLDFGIAKVLRPDSAAQTANLTRVDVRPFTPHYASPEQVRGEPITTASDVYSLGVLLYELLTGQEPYRLKKRTARELERAICETEPERPSTAVTRLREPVVEGGENREDESGKLRRRLRGDLDLILLMALRKEPQRRYASVERFSDDIRHHLERMPVSAHGDSWTYRLGKFAGRHKVGVPLAALMGLALILSTAVSLYYAHVARVERAMALQLSSFILTDFDNAMQTGVTPARKALLDRVLQQIRQLSPGDIRDPALRKLMIQGYLKVGDLQGNLWGPNLGDAPGARQSFDKALQLAQAAWRSDGGDETLRRYMAQAQRRLGDVAAQSGDRRSALEQYRKTQEFLEAILAAHPGQPEVTRELMDICSKIGFTQYNYFGNLTAALESYDRYLQLARELYISQGPGPETRRDLAFGEERTGEMLARSGQEAEGLSRLRRAQSTYQDLLQLNPSSTTLRRDAGSVSAILGDLLAQLKHNPEAEANYRTGIRMLESLAREDPSNVQYQRDLNFALVNLADLLWQRGERAEARRLTERAIASLQPLVNAAKPSVHDLHQYCWLMLTTRFADLRDPAAVLAYARRAADLTGNSDPSILDVLARAQDLNGDSTTAAETERRAISLLPATPPGAHPSSLRRELEETLAAFQKKLVAKRL